MSATPAISDARSARTLLPLIGAAEVVYVQADICRHDLLLEIEAFAPHALEN